MRLNQRLGMGSLAPSVSLCFMVLIAVVTLGASATEDDLLAPDILAPDIEPRPARSRGALVFRSMTPTGEVVVGMQEGMPGFTDAAFGLPPLPLNELELAKLEMARRAVEAAEAAGTRWIALRRSSDTPVTFEDVEAIKLERLRSLPPRGSTSRRAATPAREVTP